MRRDQQIVTRRRLGRGIFAAVGALCLPLGAQAGGSVRIGYQKDGALPILRQHDGLGSLGLGVEWVLFPSGPPLLEALAAGAVDFGATGDTPPIFAQAAGADLVYVGGQPLSGANDAVLVPADSPIHQVADLRGKRLAFTKGSTAHAMVVMLLHAAGMTTLDVQPVYLQPPDGAAAFRAGAVDAWAVWDPFFAVAQADPATRVLITAADGAQTASFFLAHRRFAEGRPQTVLALLDAINGVADWARAHPDELAQSMSAVTGVSTAVEKVAALRGMYAVQPMTDAIIARQQAIADLFASDRIIPNRVDVRSIVWSPSRIATGSRP